MAVRYTRSTDGSDADNGTTWALAKATIAGVAAIDTAGDTLWVSQSHAETAAAPTFSFAGTNASPVLLLCGNDAAEPPTAMATTATVTPSSGSITINGSVYCYGISFITASGILLARSAQDIQIFENCNFHYTGSNSTFGPLGTANIPTKVKLINTGLKFLSATSQIAVSGLVEIIGGSILSGSSAITVPMFGMNSSDRTHVEIHISSMDLSNGPTGLVLFGVAALAPALCTIRNCKLPASWSGTLTSGTIPIGVRAEMHNCDSGATNYRLWTEEYTGTVKHDTAVVKTGGASDGVTPISWKLLSTANASYPAQVLKSPEIVQWNDATGSSKTVTVDIAHSVVAGGGGAGTADAYTDQEVWLEVEYLGSSGQPLGTFITDAKADYLATPADQASSSASWSGIPGTPIIQKLSVTFTPQMKGFIHARVALARASRRVYVDPLIVVS